MLHEPKLASYEEVVNKWDICDLFESHEIMDLMQVVKDDEKIKANMKKPTR